MDPIISSGIDPALLRVLEKRGQERHPERQRRRAPVPGVMERDGQEDAQGSVTDGAKHELDDLA